MSLTAFKRKSVINYGSKRSGTAPGGVWLPQGPFGHSTTGLQLAINNPGNSGFSINGGHRNIGGVGRDMKMSKSGTPYRGTQPIGWGGSYGKYPSATLIGTTSNGTQSTGAVPNAHSKAPAVQPLLNSRVVDTMGTQYLYIKPSTLSTHGMLDKKYRWAYYGQYPNYWVQPNYTGNQTDSASQWLYIQNKAAANTCNLKVNNVGTYEGYNVKTGPTLCTPGTSTARFKYNDMARNAPYTKTLYQPVSYGQYNLYLTRGCNNPIGPQNPFPFAVQGGTSQAASGTSITSFASGCGTSNIYLTPPSWYTGDVLEQEPTTNTPNNGKIYIKHTARKPNGVNHPPQNNPFANR
jgi:hypothetical protein